MSITVQNHALYKEKIGILISLFPVVFDKEDPKPLPIGAAEMLLEIPDLGLDADSLAAVMQCWCCRREYIRSAIRYKARFNFDGSQLCPMKSWELKGILNRYKAMRIR